LSFRSYLRDSSWGDKGRRSRAISSLSTTSIARDSWTRTFLIVVACQLCRHRTIFHRSHDNLLNGSALCIRQCHARLITCINLGNFSQKLLKWNLLRAQNIALVRRRRGVWYEQEEDSKRIYTTQVCPTHQIYTHQVEAKRTNPRSIGKVIHNVKGEFVPELRLPVF
jgi:hypothetical protein